MDDVEIQGRLAARLRPWLRKATTRVAAAVADARAHAETAVTAALRATPDGRPSLARLRRSPSYLAALARLDALLADLAGPAVTSLDGLVQDCAEDCYRDAVGLWSAEVPAEFRAPGSPPTAAQARYARGLLWHGLPIRTGLDPAFVRTKAELAAATGLAGSTSATRRAGTLALRGWEAAARARLIRAAMLAMGDLGQRANLQAMTDVIDPKYLTAEAARA